MQQQQLRQPLPHLQQRQQQHGLLNAVAASITAAFPGEAQQAGRAATLPRDPWAQRQHPRQFGTAAAVAAYEHWRGGEMAEHLCLRAEDLVGSGFDSRQREAMLRAFFQQHGAAAVTEAEEERWLQQYFPDAAAGI
jgi:hypothetical protein